MELIDKTDLINKIKDSLCKGCKSYHGIRCIACNVNKCLSKIDDALVIDAVPVVRCRDCVKRDITGVCRYHFDVMRGGWFCWAGERKELSLEKTIDKNNR